MARISTYPTDESINGNDILIGTDSNDDNATKSYTLSELKNYFNTGIDLPLGWGRYDDTLHLISNKKTLTALSDNLVPNNKGNVIELGDFSFYNGSKLLSEIENSCYLLTIAFKASISNANGYAELKLNGGNGTPYERVTDTIVFPKGSNVEHSFSKVFQYYSDEDVVTNGLSVVVNPSHTMLMWDIIFFVQRTQKAI